jgi:hypothetical protein
MFHSKPFKKDLTPFAKGGKVVKHVGKGAREQTRGSGGSESLTGADSLARMANSYPKAAAGPAPTESLGGPALGSSPVPMGSRPPPAPTAMMPSGGGEEPDGDEAA